MYIQTDCLSMHRHIELADLLSGDMYDSVYGAGAGFWHEMLRTLERNGHQEAGHYRADIVRNCTCYPKPLLKHLMPNHFSLYKRCRL